MERSRSETFHKSERLCSTKIITEIFRSGEIFYSSLFRVGWIISSVPLPSPAQAAISIPKKCIRLAVTRNLIRRRIREAYRRHKQELYECLKDRNVQIAFIIIYSRNTVPDYKVIEGSVREIIRNLCTRLHQRSEIH